MSSRTQLGRAFVRSVGRAISMLVSMYITARVLIGPSRTVTRASCRMGKPQRLCFCHTYLGFDTEVSGCECTPMTPRPSLTQYDRDRWAVDLRNKYGIPVPFAPDDEDE